MPTAEQDSAEAFDHLVQLTATIKGEELFSLEVKEILHRLYHEEDVILYEPQAVEFRCTCSRQRCADTLVTLSDEDVNHILQKDGNIDMACEYCGTHYIFDADDLAAIRAEKKNQLH